MPKSASKPSAGNRALRSVRKARAYARGQNAEGFIVHVPDDVDVRAIRKRMHLTQAAFALRFGFTASAIRDWEQHRRKPEKAARILLRVIERRPEAVLDALDS